MTRAWWWLGLLLLWPGWAWSLEGFTWDFDRSFPNQPSSFRLTYRYANDPGGVLQQLGIPWHPLSACLGSAAPTPATADRFCTEIPCLPPGLYSFGIAAIWPDAESKGQDLVTCQATAQCECLEVEPQSPPAAAPPVAPGPTPPPLVASSAPDLPVFQIPQVAPA